MIGQATMEQDGTLVLDLVARGGSARGDARRVYPPTHAEYARIIAHLGGIAPGETKPVPAWPDPWDARRVEAAARAYVETTLGWPADSYTLDITGTDADGNACVALTARSAPPVEVRVGPADYAVARVLALPVRRR